MSTPVNHHYVPQCYLRQFTNENKKLFTLDIDLIKAGRSIRPSKPKSPSQVGFIKHLYKLNDNGDYIPRGLKEIINDSSYIENKLFVEIENNLADIFNAILSFEILNYEKSFLLSKHLFSGKTRSPYLRNALKPEGMKLMSNIVKKAIMEVKSADDNMIGRNLSKDELIQVAQNIEQNFKSSPTAFDELHNGILLRREFELDHVGRFAEQHLLKFKWYIFKTDPKNKFITTDNPGFFLNTKTNKIHNTHFGRDFIYYLPINPLNCLVISDSKIDYEFFNCNERYKTIQMVTTKPNQIKLINEGTLTRAYKYIISDNTDSLNICLDTINKMGLAIFL